MKKIILLFLILLAGFSVTGCIFQVKKKTPTKTGIFKSIDKGDNWKQKNTLVVTGGLSSIDAVNITKMYMDPNDNNAIYVITDTRGIFYTYNGGDNWMQPPQLSSGSVLALSVDSKDKCIIYASIGSKMYKSIDCNRSYQEIYTDPRKIQVLSIGVDPLNNLRIYAGTSQGEYIRSIDGGRSWNTIYNFRNPVKKILLDPKNPKIHYVILGKGLFKSEDSGVNWTNLKDGLKQFNNAQNAIDIIFNPSQPQSLILLSQYGILKTLDGGLTWEAYNLITPPLSVKINAVAINPQNDKEIYYGTSGTFYKTEDGGRNWIAKKLPSAAKSQALLIDPINPRIIYLGTFIEVKK